MRTSLLVAATASGLAGLVHAAAAGSHGDERTLVWLFAGCAVAQLGWALAVRARTPPNLLLDRAPGGAIQQQNGTRLVLVGGIAFQLACVATWAVSRTAGLPIDGLREAEAVGTQDLVAAVLAVVAAAGAALALARPAVPLVRSAAATALVVTFAVGLGVPAVAAGHDHDHEHAEAADHDHEHADGETDGPITSVDDPRLTDEQRDAAESLIDATMLAMAAYPTAEAAEAAGYTSIGDGRVSGFEHLINRDNLTDGRELDPEHVEAIVLAVEPDGTRTVASAMYVLEPGSTMDDVPEIAGELSVWHDHDNLCWDGDRLAGVLRNGRCRPAGELRATPPMLHVWLTPQTCGPFAGIEGHGEGCDHPH